MLFLFDSLIDSKSSYTGVYYLSYGTSELINLLLSLGTEEDSESDSYLLYFGIGVLTAATKSARVMPSLSSDHG